MAQLVKNPSACKARCDLWVGQILWRRERLPTPVSWRIPWAVYSPWGRKESGQEIEAQRSDGRQQTRGGARNSGAGGLDAERSFCFFWGSLLMKRGHLVKMLVMISVTSRVVPERYLISSSSLSG